MGLYFVGLVIAADNVVRYFYMMEKQSCFLLGSLLLMEEKPKRRKVKEVHKGVSVNSIKKKRTNRYPGKHERVVSVRVSGMFSLGGNCGRPEM